MAFLASKKVIHRDLAARNILVDTNGNNSFSGNLYIHKHTHVYYSYVSSYIVDSDKTFDPFFTAVDQWKCKIADFGFARDIMANNMYERKTDGKLPIR